MSRPQLISQVIQMRFIIAITNSLGESALSKKTPLRIFSSDIFSSYR